MDAKIEQDIGSHSGPIGSAFKGPKSLELASLQDGQSISGVCFSERLALTASSDKTARVWNADSGKCLQTLSGHEGIVTCVRFTGDYRRVITTSADGTLKVWSVDTGECICTLSGHTCSVRCAAL